MTTTLPRPQRTRWHDDPEPGPGSPPSVLLVHGTLDRAHSFRGVARCLRDRSVHGYDRRGWASREPIAEDSPALLQHVSELVDVLAGAGRPVVVGHSYGALVAMGAAAREPDLVEAVVAYEPPVRWLPWWPTEAPWEAVVREHRDAGPGAVARAMTTEILGRPVESEPELLEQDGLALLAEMTDPLMDEPLFDPLAFPRPLVTAAGSHTLHHHRDVAERLAELTPHGRFAEVAGAGHAAHVTHPREFAGLVDIATADALGTDREEATA